MKNKVCVVTGAGGVLCASFAKEMAKNGYAVALLDINLDAANAVAEEIKKNIKGHLICLDIQGKQISSEEMAKKIENLSQTTSTISFVIGASNGIHDEIKSLSNEKISFSKMTFPHQLMRVIFLEQLYRAFTINNNISYHK